MCGVPAFSLVHHGCPNYKKLHPKSGIKNWLNSYFKLGHQLNFQNDEKVRLKDYL